MSDEPDNQAPDEQASTHQAIDDAVEAHIEEANRSGGSWQEREARIAGEIAKSDDKVGAITDGILKDAIGGQDAAEILGEAAFEAASPSILDQPLLMVSQPATAIETSDRYDYALPDGTVVAIGEQTNQGAAHKVLRMVGNVGSMMKSVIEVTQDGQRVFGMERKGSVGKNTMLITDASGNEVGEVKQTKRGQKRASFELRTGRTVLATMQTGHVHQGQGFDIVGPDGTPVAWVRRLIANIGTNVATSMLSSPDTYVLRIAAPLSDPLRTLVVATPMSVDSAVNQDDKGFDLGDLTRMGRKFT